MFDFFFPIIESFALILVFLQYYIKYLFRLLAFCFFGTPLNYVPKRMTLFPSPCSPSCDIGNAFFSFWLHTLYHLSFFLLGLCHIKFIFGVLSPSSISLQGGIQHRFRPAFLLWPISEEEKSLIFPLQNKFWARKPIPIEYQFFVLSQNQLASMFLQCDFLGCSQTSVYCT